MKRGMMDVGIFCKEPRFGISTEKGTVTTTRFNSVRSSSAAFVSHLLTCVVVVVVVVRRPLIPQTAASPSS